jgi:hypothetical protein
VHGVFAVVLPIRDDEPVKLVVVERLDAILHAGIRHRERAFIDRELSRLVL